MNLSEEYVNADLRKTQLNREKLIKNKNLLFWYRVSFELQFSKISNIEKKNILEIGSGTSPMKLFFTNILTSDILNLDYLDYVFDCHEIDILNDIPDNTLDIITVTNVLHHLNKPVDFLLKACTKLKPLEMVNITEPYFSYLSYFIYKFLHHEKVNLKIVKPELDIVKGPMSNANIALPYLIFFSNKKNWKQKLKFKYDIKNCEIDYFTSISYFMTGGISHKFQIPFKIYKLIFKIDLYISRLLPNFFASFFILRMKRV